MQKQAVFKIKGMQRDLSASAFNSEYAYENKNVRIMPTDENTLFSLVNEKGNKAVSISGVGNYIKGTPIGQSLINDELVLFTCGDDSIDKEISIEAEPSTIGNINAEESTINLDFSFYDRIYKLWFDSGTLKGKELFKGDLNFNYKNPIEALSFYENSELKKVYWTDGLNQPRVINIAASSNKISKWTNDSFNFVNKLKLSENISIQRNKVTSGNFASGVLQYAFTYVNTYGQESNIFYTSPLYYTSYSNRGASPEDKVSNSFDITIERVDKSFDCLRIYSIHRTSINSIPEVKRITDISIPTSGTYAYDKETYSKHVNIDKISVRNRSTKEYTLLSNLETTSSNYWKIEGSTYDVISFNNENLYGDDFLLLSTNNSIGFSVNTNRGTITASDYNNKFKLYTSKIVTIKYTDTGTSGDYIDPTELLYKGGEDVVFGTMTQKDNTLFLGDISVERKVLSSTIKNEFRKQSITFGNYLASYNKYITPPPPLGYYPYENQLSKNSYQIKAFKYLEWYRFGIQAQHYTGKWSEPIWIKDAQNTSHIKTTFYKSDGIYLPVAMCNFENQDIIKELIHSGYTRIRPVIVYPDIQDRECICQGILCPTVYNVSDRYGNSPFAQSSWFIRPNAPFDIDKSKGDFAPLGGAYDNCVIRENEGGGPSIWDCSYTPSVYSKAGILANNRIITYNKDTPDIKYSIDTINKGAWAEFRHNYPIPGNNNRNAEIQCISNPPNSPTVSNTDSYANVSDWVAENSENFYIDQSILTLHSPDIEFDDSIRSLDTSNLKLRIVGMVPLTAFASSIDIQTSTPPNNFIVGEKEQEVSTELPIGFYKEPIGVENDFTTTSVLAYTTEKDSNFGWRSLISGAFWFDEVSDRKGDTSNNDKLSYGFAVYPWHRNGSLNNTKSAKDGYRSAMLDKKKMSNIKFSYKSVYFDKDNIWKAYIGGSSTKTGISGVSIFDSNEVSLVKLKSPENSSLNDINYYGNIDKVVTIPTAGDKKNGYPIISTGRLNIDADSPHDLFSSNFGVDYSDSSNSTTSTDPVRIKYKSTPHAVLALNYSKNNYQRVLPTIKDGRDSSTSFTREWWNVNYIGESLLYSKFFWDTKSTIKGVSQDVLEYDSTMDGPVDNIFSIQHGWLWLGELYNDNVINRFGGQTEEAFENNQWLPCGEPVSLIDDEGKIKESVLIKWEEGDTYYQRYDHIKTYPFTLEDQNAMTEIVSFMCETRVNLDGRYDRNRGQVDNLAITPENFNKLNDVYSQSNNFFNYRGLNTNKLNLDNFHNSITWTKTKTAGELTDTWTNITLASILDLDGDKGSVRALRRLNNNLVAFQDTGISQILYNENMQIASTEGVPIEIANSGKVTGKRYISDRIGCTNKWSICETSNGIYFIDDITKGIYLFNGKLDNLSDRLGFHSWINSESKSLNIWNPVDFNSFVTYYDKTNGDVLFINKSNCLAFSEPLGQFSSFYSYENTPFFANLEDRGLFINKDSEGLYKPWLHNEGEYNMFFGEYQPFYTTVVANPNATTDKIFNNLEFRADSWNNEGKLLNTTFDTLTTWNEYQEGIASLTNVLGRPSDLKRKFRMWRANIPRAKANGRDRMRNPWLYIKLSMDKENNNKTILHDMVVHYFE